MPTNSTAMKYNSSYHFYILDPDYLKANHFVDFVATTGSKTKAQNLCLRNSRTIYNYIYNHKQRNKRYWEWFLAFDTEVRDVIQQALIEQAIFEYESNASALQNQLGINPLNGVVLKLEDLRGERRIALEAINVIRNFQDGRLFFTGKEMYITPTDKFDYEEMEY